MRTYLKLVLKNYPLFAIFFIAIQAIITPANACFDDEKLKNLLQTSPNSLIYVWSPRMVLSVTQAHLAAEQAHLLGLQFVPLVDGRIPAVEWQSAVRQAVEIHQTRSKTPTKASTKAPVDDASVLSASQALCATSLIDTDAYLHFPTAFVAQNGQIHPQKLIGAMPANFWHMGISARQTPIKTPLPMPSGSALVQFAEKATVNVPEEVPTQCIPANQFIALDPKQAGLDDNKEVALGAYERVSPDGRFVLRSYSGKRLTAVSLVELPNPPQATLPANAAYQTQRVLETPFSNEAFPVQGSWRYLVDTNGSYYEFASILRNQSAAKPLFKGGMTGFYAAAAEVDSTYPLRNNQSVRIRSLSWPNASSEADSQGEGMLTVRTLTVDPTVQGILADSGRVNLCLNRVAVDGPMYALPMLSVDGYEFATLPQIPVAGEPTMRIFGLGTNGQQCEPLAQFKSLSGKVIFGFSDKQKEQAKEKPNDKGTLADVAYEYRGQIWWYQRATATPFNLAPWEDASVSDLSDQTVTRQNVLASAFPGMTRDGRVIYAATWKRCLGRVCAAEGGYVVADPWQSNAYKTHVMQNLAKSKVTAKTCITVQDVARERSAFAAFHGISN